MIVKIRLKVLVMGFLILLFGQGCAGTLSKENAQRNPTIPEASAQQIDLSQMDVHEWASTSSDGKWVAVGLVAIPPENGSGKLAYVRLMVFSADGKTHWTIIDHWQELGLGFPMPEPLKWSQDSQYFYFTHRVTPDGCSVFPFLTDLQRVSLEDGTVSELLPQTALTLALSPDESKVAYLRSGESGLVLRDLNTKEVRETKIDPGRDFNAGNILWSPDGKSLTLTVAINPCMGDAVASRTVQAQSTSILLVDAKTLQQKVLIKEDPRLFVTWQWKEPERITLTDGRENALWYLNVNTGEITRQ